MRGAWRCADIAAAEAKLIATLPELTLMRRAATGLARRCALLLRERGGVYGGPVLLLIGAGNNGGDALFAGALLAQRGAAVRALLLDPARAHQAGVAALRRAGGAIVSDLPNPPDSVDLVLDGIVGIGARGGLRPPAAQVVARLGALAGRDGHRSTVVSVDVPSGVDVDTGALPGPAVAADVTVTFGCLKPALVVGPAAPLAGQVDLVDIGLPALATPAMIQVPDVTDIAAWWPAAVPSSDKYSRGVAGIATGSVDFPGAALMSVAGAVAGPAGMIRYAGAVAAEVIRSHPEVVVSDRVAEAGRVQAWVCGSGLGTTQTAVDEVRAVLGAPVPVVLDADALTLISEADLAGWLRRRDAPTVVTPHDREFARIAGHPVGDDRVGAARRLAADLGLVVVLKGDRTVVASAEGAAWGNPTGTPALATAGTGDVLAGLLASLLAGGLSASRAAIAAAYLHGLAGRLAAQRFGGHLAPVTAVDVAACLPGAVAALERVAERDRRLA